jgi:hypothetical protein
MEDGGSAPRPSHFTADKSSESKFAQIHRKFQADQSYECVVVDSSSNYGYTISEDGVLIVTGAFEGE